MEEVIATTSICQFNTYVIPGQDTTVPIIRGFEEFRIHQNTLKKHVHNSDHTHSFCLKTLYDLIVSMFQEDEYLSKELKILIWLLIVLITR